jgi:hypothetical protein
VLIYAAYRKRFTAEEVSAWAQAEWVVPAFATVLNHAPAPAPATALLVPSLTGWTGLFFADASGVPTQVQVIAVPTEGTVTDRATARETLLRTFPQAAQIVELEADSEFDPAAPQGALDFRAGTWVSRFSTIEANSLDIRDKDDLADRRRDRVRDVVLWRLLLGCAAAIALSLLLEFALVGLGFWHRQNLTLEARQKPVVAGIMTSQTLATRIDELSTKRLLPFEMLALVNTVRPGSIQFMRTVTSGLTTLEIDAQTNSSGDIDIFRSALNQLEGCQKAEVIDPRSRDGISTFKLVVTFRPEFLKQLASPSAEPSPPSIPTLEAKP